MKINVIIYLLIILFSFILLHPILFPIQEGIDGCVLQEGTDECLVNTLENLKIEVAELKLKIDPNVNSTPEPASHTYSAEENGNFLLNNIGSLN